MTETSEITDSESEGLSPLNSYDSSSSRACKQRVMGHLMLSQEDNDGYSPVATARLEGHDDLADLMESYMSDV